jgi:PPM family protein phosphatase
MGPHDALQVPRVEVAARSDPGRDPDKQVNEDCAGYQATPLGHLLVVCDGMGGHALGQEASKLAVSTIVRAVAAARTGSAPAQVLAGAIVEAGRLVYQMGGPPSNAGRPGSTCVAVLVHARGCEVAHVGDSRAFLARRGQIWQITRDHSVVQQMVDAGAISPLEAQSHPDANMITRALGMHPETDVEIKDPPLTLEQGDTLVLATDGLTDLVSADQILGTLVSSSGIEAACDALVKLANARGGHDNITVQMLRVLDLAAAATLNETPAMTPLMGTVSEPQRVAPTLIDHALGSTVVPGPGPVPVPGPGPVQVSVPQRHTEPAMLRSDVEAATPVARGGRNLIVLGIALVALILAGVAAWWAFGPH